jgi:RNA polymerase sigma-70 factor (ECF subfamily)
LPRGVEGGAPSDRDLVRRAQAGDSSAFGSLVQRHQPRIYNLCLRVTGSAHDAEDACQDAFVSAFRKLSTFKGDAAFTTWMHRVAVNACYDHLRRRQRQPMLHAVPDDLEDREREAGPPVPDHADALATALDVAEALARVPEDFRIALVLADVQDLPYDEIARVLGVPIGTVKSRVFRGRVALGRLLETGGGEPRTAPAASEDR